MDSYKNPSLATDGIVVHDGKIVLVRRKNPPLGWALPGGFVNDGEAAFTACRREIKEETRLIVQPLQQFHTYSKPNRDPRKHVVSIVYICDVHPDCRAEDAIKGQDDAAEAKWFSLTNLPWEELVFDHHFILHDYIQWTKIGTYPFSEA